MYIKEDSVDIRIDGYQGSWYVIDKMNLYNFNRDFAVTLYLLESEQHGDEWPCLIVSKFGNVVVDDAYNGFEELKYMEEF